MSSPDNPTQARARNTGAAVLMDFGKYKGQPVADMSTGYLLWLASNDAIRFKRWPLMIEALNVLRSRFEHFDTLLAELHVPAPPPEYWKAKKLDRTAEKAEKLRQLEARRAEDRRKRVEAFRERRRLELEQELRERAEALRQHRSVDGYYLARQPAPTNCDDLL